MHVSIKASARNDVSKWPWSCVIGYVAFPGHSLKEGSSGPDVTAIQNRLAELGYGVKTDGRFGAKTKQALMQFQRDSKLTPDGVVGGKTWAVLMAGPARRPSLSTTSSP